MILYFLRNVLVLVMAAVLPLMNVATYGDTHELRPYEIVEVSGEEHGYEEIDLEEDYDFEGNDEELDSSICEIEVAAFDVFLEEEFLEYVTMCPITINTYLQNPEDFGITDFEITWEGFISVGQVEEDIAATLDRINTFGDFNRGALTPTQQQSYDILEWQIETYLMSLDAQLYYFRSALQGSSGMHQLLPIMLGEYNFNNQQDIDNYLILLSEIGVVFEDAISLEEYRIERGLPLSDRIIDEIIETSQGFIDNVDTNTLLTTFEVRLNRLDFLSNDEIEDYIEQNNHIFITYVVPAYESLIDSLENIKGNLEGDYGIAHFDKGADFFHMRMRSMGSSYTPGEMFELLDNRIREVSEDYLNILRFSPEVFDYFQEDIHPFDCPVELMEFLIEQSDGRFASLPEGVGYEINRIDESLGSFAAGFYLVPQLDNYLENVIYYNPEFADDNEFMYSLMAHEGIGHLVHFTNIWASDLSNFRKLNTLGFSANVEGWAMHAQLYSYNFLNLSEVNTSRLVLWDEFIFLMGAVVDIGVNYKGWSLEDTVNYLNGIDLLVAIPNEYLEESFFTVVSNPTRSIPYAAGLFEIRELQEHFEDLLGIDFDLLIFNETYLSKGLAPFPLMRKWMEEALL